MEEIYSSKSNVYFYILLLGIHFFNLCFTEKDARLDKRIKVNKVTHMNAKIAYDCSVTDSPKKKTRGAKHLS